MEELTAEEMDKKAFETADRLTKEIQELNKKYSGPSPPYPREDLLRHFAIYFARLLADRYIIVPSKT